MTATEADVVDLSTQAKTEAEFFDKVYADADKRHSLQQYMIPAKFIDQVLNPKPHSLDAQEYAMALLGDLEGKSLLDYGAGDGWRTVCFAKANPCASAGPRSRITLSVLITLENGLRLLLANLTRNR